MTTNGISYKRVYLGIDIEPTIELLEKQKEVCQRYGLIPRQEFHITIAYLGNVNHGMLTGLIAELSHDCTKLLAGLNSNGFGIAIEKEGIASLVADQVALEGKGLPIVSWLSIERNEVIAQYRTDLAAIALRLGFKARYLSSHYLPHITMGSNGPKDGHYWGAWDAHRVKKVKTIDVIESPSVIIPRKVHITNAQTHPNSLITICQ